MKVGASWILAPSICRFEVNVSSRRPYLQPSGVTDTVTGFEQSRTAAMMCEE